MYQYLSGKRLKGRTISRQCNVSSCKTSSCNEYGLRTGDGVILCSVHRALGGCCRIYKAETGYILHNSNYWHISGPPTPWILTLSHLCPAGWEAQLAAANQVP